MSLCKTLIDKKEVLEMDYNRGHLLSFYENIEEKRKERDAHIEVVQRLDKDIQISLLEYRINSAIRVLEYFKGLDTDFDNLITHCIDKLNGNIDGIELELGEKDENK